MFANIPPLILPPIPQPASRNPAINKLLDKAHFYLRENDLAESRRALFEAYL